MSGKELPKPEQDEEVSDRRFFRATGLAAVAGFVSFLGVIPFVHQHGAIKVVPAAVAFLVFIRLLYQR